MDNRAVEGNYVDEIRRQRSAWEKKSVLRDVYARYFSLVASHLATGGPVLEIGGGSGRLKEYLNRDVVTSDVFQTPWIDVQLDAHHFPVRNAGIRNIVAIDVLHHLPDPIQFFRECIRVLPRGGRILLLEPHISVWGYFIYRYVHHEGCTLRDDVWGSRPAALDHNFANAALPWLVLGRGRKRFEIEFPQLRISHSQYLDFLAYPATGGFSYGPYLPSAIIKTMLRGESAIPGVVMKYLTGMRAFFVIERL